ncbi:MAG: NmrA family NAD(P)-binding protein [Bacteroidota bacterium]
MKSNILVIGGTGKTGRRVVERLQNLGQNVRIGSRRAEPTFDWNEPATYGPALEGMDKAYVVYSPDLAVPGARKAIEQLTVAAKAAGLKKLVILSGKGEVEAQICEGIVMNSGLDYTVVRASWFMQNFSESFFLDPILAGQVALPKVEAQVPYVNADDIADVVVQALLDEQHNGQIYQLTGPETLTFPEVIGQIAQASGREIQFSAITMEAYGQMLEAVGLPADYRWLINYLFTEVLDAPGNNDVTGDIEKVLGRKPLDFATYVKETVKTGVWNQSVPESM